MGIEWLQLKYTPRTENKVISWKGDASRYLPLLKVPNNILHLLYLYNIIPM